jgi:hypothetical protein
MAYLKYDPISGVKPWTGPNIGANKLYFLRLSTNEKQTFSQISDIINFTHTDISKCLIDSGHGLSVFQESNRILTAKLGHDCIKELVFPFTNEYAPEYIVNSHYYRVCTFTFVSHKRVRSSLVTKINFAIYIEFLFPCFALPYLYIPLHPKYPLREWKSPDREGFYAEFELFLRQNKSQNYSLFEVSAILNSHIQASIKQLISKCHLVRNHPATAIKLPLAIIQEHCQIRHNKEQEFKESLKKQDVSDTQCVKAASLHDQF